MLCPKCKNDKWFYYGGRQKWDGEKWFDCDRYRCGNCGKYIMVDCTPMPGFEEDETEILREQSPENDAACAEDEFPF